MQNAIPLTTPVDNTYTYTSFVELRCEGGFYHWDIICCPLCGGSHTHGG